MTDDGIGLMIGQLQGTLSGLTDAVEKQNTAIQKQGVESRESRSKIYERMGKVETAIELSGQIDAQVRVRLGEMDSRLTEMEKEINKRIDDNIMPTVNEVKRWKLMGIGALVVVGMGSAAIGALVIWAWDVISSKLHI